jgi:hypothetical protein
MRKRIARPDPKLPVVSFGNTKRPWACGPNEVADE